MTAEQAEMLESFESGRSWTWFQSSRGDEILHFLMNHGLCTPREDIAPGWMEITEEGRTALADFRIQKAQEEKREREKERAETVRLQERHQDQADEERRYRTQNKIAIIMPLVTFVLGMLVEHFYRIIGFLSSLFH